MAIPRMRAHAKEYAPHSLRDDRAEFIEAPAGRSRAARGALIGILLGMGFWGAILVLLGVIKL